MAKVTITISENVLGGANVEVSPKPEVLNAAAGGTALTVAETYALGALNYIRDNAEGIASLPKPRQVKRAFRTGFPVQKVSIILEDRGNGASCVAQPSFNELAALIAGGTEATTAHKTALVALGRIVQMGRGAKGGRAPGEVVQ